jgi:hypothetical protein
MPVTAEDLEHLPYLDRNLGRVFTKDCKENIKLFIRDFRAGNVGSQIKEAALDTGENLDAILEDAQAQTGREDVNLREYEASARRMWLIGDLKPKKATAPVVDDVERDKLGRPLSSKALQWKRWEEWCNDPKTKSADIAQLRKNDAKFREFFEYQYKLRLSEEPVGDRCDAVGTAAIRQDKSVRVTQALRDFAAAYRVIPTSEVRRLSSPAMNPSGYQKFVSDIDSAIAAGLI